MMISPLLVLREGKADGFTNKLDERSTLLTLHDDSPLLVLREGKADGYTNKLDERFALVGVARRKSGWLHQQA
jgi:hypothetical protein